jgi:hypothetical protein
MRTTLTGALLVLGALPLGAQQDSTARRDSLLERERRRIQGEATSREPERAPAKVKTPGLGWRSRVRVGVGVAGPSTWLEDASGLSVQSDVAPTVVAEYRFPRARGVEYLVGARASRAGVTMDASPSYDAGSMYLFDLFASSVRTFGDRFSLRSGLVAVVVAGGDVAPFTEASRLAPGFDLGAALRLTRQVPLSVSLGLQVLRYGGNGSTPSGAQPGNVPRVMLELRHGY